MPNSPLPKPAVPTPPAPPAPPASSVAPSQPTAPQPLQQPSVPSASGSVFPPQSQMKVGAPPVPPPPVAAAGSVAPAQPQPSMGVAAPGRPTIPVARPGAPLPTQSIAPPPLPGTPVAPQPAQQPPTTLTALDTMSSTNIPDTGKKSDKLPPPPPGAGINAASSLPAPEPGKGNKPPQFAEPKKSPLRFLPFVLVGVVILAVLGFAAYQLFGKAEPKSVSNNNSSTGGSGSSTSTQASSTPEPVAERTVIEYWGLWEPTETMTQIIKDYEAQNPKVTINYTKQSHKDYRVRLRTALVQGENGPDIFRYHASWVPMMTAELSPLPSSVMTSTEYQNTFYPIAAEMLNVRGQIVGIPLMYEGLALYYNTEIFSTAVVEPPKTWSDLRTLASKLTVKAGSSIKRSGVALGNASNVEHFSDILAVLMLQNGADLTKPNSPQTRDALLFYTNFIKTDDVWDETLPLSSVAFARGDVAMIFAPSWRAHEIKQMNPNLPFKVVPLPQLSDTRIGYANFWAEGVNAQSSNKQEAWNFLKYLSSADVQKKLYASQSQIRPFGEIYSRKDLAESLANDPVVSAYLQDAPYAKGSYMSSYTHDEGLNDQIIQYYVDAVNELLKGADTEEVLINLDKGVQQVLRNYGAQSSGS